MSDDGNGSTQIENALNIKQELVEEGRKSNEHSMDEEPRSVPEESGNDVSAENNLEGDGQEAVEDELDDDDEEEDEGLNVIIRPMTRTLSGSNAYKSVSSNYTNKSLTNVSMGAKQAKLGVDLDDPGDINGNPTLDYNFSFLKDEDKPWKIPGADINDYFNYGFTEETWIQYCEKQRSIRQQYGGSLKSTITSMSSTKPSRPLNRNPINVIGSNIASDLGPIPSLVMSGSNNLPNLSLTNSSRPSSLLGNAEKSISLPLTNVPPPPLPASFNPGVPPPNFTVPPPGYNANSAQSGAPITPGSIVGGPMFNSIPGANVPVGMISPTQSQHPQSILNAMAILQQMNPQQIMAAAGAIPPHILPGGTSIPGMPFSGVTSGNLMGSLTGDGREKTPDSLGSGERDLDDDRHHGMRQKSRGSLGDSYMSSSRHRETPIKKDREYFEQKDRAREMQRRARDAIFASRYERGESYRSRRRSRSGSREKEKDRDRDYGRESKRRKRYEDDGSDYDESDRDRDEKLDGSSARSDKADGDQSAEESRKSRRRRGDADDSRDSPHHYHSSSKYRGSRGERDERSSHRDRERLPSESSSRRHKRDHHRRDTRSRSRSHSTGRESRRPSTTDRNERSRRDRSSRSPTGPSQDEEQHSRSGRHRSKYGGGGDREERRDVSETRVQSEVTAVPSVGGSDSTSKGTLSRWETEEPGMN